MFFTDLSWIYGGDQRWVFMVNKMCLSLGSERGWCLQDMWQLKVNVWLKDTTVASKQERRGYFFIGLWFISCLMCPLMDFYHSAPLPGKNVFPLKLSHVNLCAIHHLKLMTTFLITKWPHKCKIWATDTEHYQDIKYKKTLCFKRTLSWQQRLNVTFNSLQWKYISSS